MRVTAKTPGVRVRDLIAKLQTMPQESYVDLEGCDCSGTWDGFVGVGDGTVPDGEATYKYVDVAFVLLGREGGVDEGKREPTK